MEITELKKENERLREALNEKDKLIEALKSKVAILEILHFGPKSERWTPEDKLQARLFNEAEDEAFKQIADGDKKKYIETLEVGPYIRRKRNRNQGRKPLSKDLPRIFKVYDIAEDEKECACGAKLTCIGADISERLQIKPIEVFVLQEKRLKYSCKKCEGTESDRPGVITAEGKKHLIPGSIATSSLLAWILTEKFEFALPFYRQEKRLAHIGVHLPRATLSGFAIRAGNRCKPLYELIKKHIISGSLVNADETEVQVLTEPGRKAQTKSWMCVYLGGPVGKKAVIFLYTETRASSVPKEMLTGFKGTLQTDDLSVYQTAVKELNKDRPEGEKIKHILCWAHVRRKFDQAWKVTKSEHAATALNIIQSIFELEDLRKEHSIDEFMVLRKKRAVSIFDEFLSWMKELFPKVPPSIPIGKALMYTLDNWEQLITYINDPECVPSNNLVENSIRPFVIGKKNWLFCDTPAGAEASSIIYSLIETAKLNGLHPYDYLWYVFENLPYAETEEDILRLLPFNLTPDQIKPPREEVG